MIAYASPPAQIAVQEVRRPYPPSSQRDLFDQLTKLATDFPQLALDRVQLLESDAQRDRILKLGFMAAISRQPQVAKQYLPLVIDRAWLGDANFQDACALAAMLNAEHSPMAEKLVLAGALKRPDVALREADRYLAMPFGRRVFEQVVRLAPDEAAGLASVQEALRASEASDIRWLATLADNHEIAPYQRGRVAVFYRRIVAGSYPSNRRRESRRAIPIFAALVDLRLSTADPQFPDRILELESLMLCRAMQEVRSTAASNDLAHLSTRDLYLLLAYGRAEANEQVFRIAFDRFLLPKLRAAGSLRHLLDETKDLSLREFVAAVRLAAHRFDIFLRIGGTGVLDRLARGVGQANDPQQAAVTVAEAIDGAAGRTELSAAITAEYKRSGELGTAPHRCCMVCLPPGSHSAELTGTSAKAICHT